MGYPPPEGEVYYEDRPVPIPPAAWDWRARRPLPVPIQVEDNPKDEQVRARVCLHLGSFVWPNVPFPYFFDLPGPEDHVAGEKADLDTAQETRPDDKEKLDSQSSTPKLQTAPESPSPSPYTVDTETRLTIVIPNAHIPRSRPARPLRIWGGGTPGRPGRPGPSSPSVRRRRRIYTDDSDVFLCAVHAGWVTWSGARSARQAGRDAKVELRVLRCVGADGPDAQGVGWGREEVVGRFSGGFGERCEAVAVAAAADVGEEDDGRGLVSAGWGAGHDGSAIEIVGFQFVDVSRVERGSFDFCR